MICKCTEKGLEGKHSKTHLFASGRELAFGVEGSMGTCAESVLFNLTRIYYCIARVLKQTAPN